MGWSGNVLTAPISLGDISVATGVGGPPYDLGTMIKNGTSINAMAKYKPFKNGNPAFADATAYNNARAAARYGFGASGSQTPIVHPLTFTQSGAGLWVYQRPSAGSPTEFYRALDFDGYHKLCAPPFILQIDTYPGGYLRKGEPFYVQILTNGSVENSNYCMQSNFDFFPGYNVNLRDLLQSDNLVSTYYVHLFVVKNSAVSNPNVIVLNKTMAQLEYSSSDPDLGIHESFILFPDGDYSHPAIPVLQSTNVNIGDTFTMCACFGNIPSGSFAPGEQYKVFTPTTGYGGDKMSLRFLEGNDRTSFLISLPASDISGSVTSFTLADTGVVEWYSGVPMRKFRISSLAAVVTAGGTGLYSFTIKVKSLDGNSSVNQFPEPPDYHWIDEATYTEARNLTAGTQTTVNLEDSNFFVWLYDQEDDTIKVEITAGRSGYTPAEILGTTCNIYGQS